MRYAKINKSKTIDLLKSKINRITISNISNISLEYFEKHLEKIGAIS